MKAPNPLHAAVSGAGPVVYYSGRVFLAVILTLGQKLGAPEGTPEHSAKHSKNIFERRFEHSNKEKSSNQSWFEDLKIQTKTKVEGPQPMPAGLGEEHIPLPVLQHRPCLPLSAPLSGIVY